jgi:hypothetical protein
MPFILKYVLYLRVKAEAPKSEEDRLVDRQGNGKSQGSGDESIQNGTDYACVG